MIQMKARTKKLLFITGAALCLLPAALPKAALALEVQLPGSTGNISSDPGAYIQYFFTYGLGLVGFLAVAAIVIGGVMYMVGGTVGKVDRAKTIITGAITGVVLLLCSYLLLALIDPSLTNLSPLKPTLAPGIVPVPNAAGGQVCANTNLVRDPYSGLCTNRPSGLGTAACDSGSATCSLAACVIGGACQPGNTWCQQTCSCITIGTGCTNAVPQVPL